jgi:hypothetical protein
MADETKIGTHWQEDELDEIVADYFAMLAADLPGSNTLNPGIVRLSWLRLAGRTARSSSSTRIFRLFLTNKDIARRVTAHSSRGVVDRYLHQDVEAIRGATALIPRLPKA